MCVREIVRDAENRGGRVVLEPQNSTDALRLRSGVPLLNRKRKKKKKEESRRASGAAFKVPWGDIEHKCTHTQTQMRVRRATGTHLFAQANADESSDPTVSDKHKSEVLEGCKQAVSVQSQRGLDDQRKRPAEQKSRREVCSRRGRDAEEFRTGAVRRLSYAAL